MNIIICNELPQWIIESDKAAYHPFTKTIYIKRGHGKYLLHELVHYLIHVFFRNNHHKWQLLWDKINSGDRK